MLLGGVDPHLGGEAPTGVQLIDGLIGLGRVKSHRRVTGYLEDVSVRLHAEGDGPVEGKGIT